MYFPYLRGKQFELIAIRELAEMISASGKIIPVIEPVKEVSSYKKTFEALHQYICELAKNLGFDGIEYRSTLYPKGTNFAVFHDEKLRIDQLKVVEIKNVTIESKEIL